MSGLLLLLAWETGEGGAERHISVDAFMRESVELALVGLHLSDEVNEVLGLSEFIQVLSINHIAKFIFYLDDKFNNVETVKTVILEAGLEGHLRLLGGAEIGSHDAEDVLLNLIVVLKNEGVLLGLGLILPEGNLALIGAALGVDHELGRVLEAKAVQEVTLGNAYHSTVEDERSHAEAASGILSQSQ